MTRNPVFACSGRGKFLSPARLRKIVNQVRRELGISERKACKALGQPRSTQRYKPKLVEKDLGYCSL